MLDRRRADRLRGSGKGPRRRRRRAGRARTAAARWLLPAAVEPRSGTMGVSGQPKSEVGRVALEMDSGRDVGDASAG